MHIFSPIVKKYAYFSQIELKFKKLKKRLNIFLLWRAPQYNKFHVGKKYKSGKGGGAKNEFQI